LFAHTEHITCNIRPNWVYLWSTIATCNGCISRTVVLQEVCNLGN
jgi:hypothetical protein